MTGITLLYFPSRDSPHERRCAEAPITPSLIPLWAGVGVKQNSTYQERSGTCHGHHFPFFPWEARWNDNDHTPCPRALRVPQGPHKSCVGQRGEGLAHRLQPAPVPRRAAQQLRPAAVVCPDECGLPYGSTSLPATNPLIPSWNSDGWVNSGPAFGRRVF